MAKKPGKKKAATKKRQAAKRAPQSTPSSAPAAAASIGVGSSVNYVRERGSREEVKVVAIDGNVATLCFPNGRELAGVSRGTGGEANTWEPLATA